MADNTTCFKEGYIPTRDGLALYYRDYQSSSSAQHLPILCLHGLTRNSRDFEDLAPRLADYRRVIVPDVRGRGKSDYDPDYKNYQIPIYVQDILAMLTTLKIDRVVVIGTSMGGLISVAIAAVRPTLLAGVVLNDVGPEVDTSGLQRIAAYTGQMKPVTNWAEAAEQVRGLNQPFFPEYGPDDWARITRRMFKPGPDGIPVADYDPDIGKALRADNSGTIPTDLWTLFGALKDIPTLAIRGEMSDILSSATFDKMSEVLPDMVRATIPDRGHAPYLDEPESLRAIHDFLEKLDDA